MTKTIAVLKWLWDFPLRSAILMGGATYLSLYPIPRPQRWFLSLLMAVMGYFWQSALAKANGKP